MKDVRFEIQRTKSSDATIYLMFYYDYSRLKMSTRLKVPEKYWSHKKQRVKLNSEFPDHQYINDKLEKIRSKFLSLYKKYEREGEVPEPKVLRNEFANLGDSPVKLKHRLGFWDHYEDFVEYKRKTIPDVRDYDNSLRKHLKKMEEKLGRKITFSLLRAPELNFAEDWMQYLTYETWNKDFELGLAPNTIGKLNKNLKVLLNWCFERNITPRFSLKAYPSITEDVEKIYLTEEELILLEAVELESKREQHVRDLFLIGCETGFRFSDFIRIKPEDIRDGEIHMRPKKTSKSRNNKVIIPISTRVERVLKKYSNKPPGYGANNVTEFNKIIRSVCEKAGIDEEVVNYRTQAGKEIRTVKKKFEEVSSHTCRRTFCTLKFLKGMPAQAIMKFSGHRTERNFLRYLKLDAKLTANQYREYF